VAELSALLTQPEMRLLTLVGAGGIGKTRLSIAVATQLRASFTSGSCFVGLAAISDEQLVVSTIARELGLKESGTQPPLEQVQVFVGEQHFLLVLDNFEQVVAAAPQIEQLLASCPNLKILVTSRAVLHLPAEQVVLVAPLALPDLATSRTTESIAQSAAVVLFVQRAHSQMPSFQLTDTNAQALAEVCIRLDGLPLAIELAAARIRLLPPQALLTHLSQRLPLLTGGPRTLPARQQTLRKTIQWSYDLLGPEEQALFRLLAVFVGGWTLEAAKALSQGVDQANLDVLNTLSALLDNSLIQQIEQEGAEPRLTMLETIREYGLDRLQESGETHVCQRAHALYYLALAEEAEPHLKGAQQVLWWKRLEREQGNLLTALDWLIGQEEGESALRLCGAVWWFWNIRGYWKEGWRGLEAALGLPQAQERTVRRAKALFGADTFAWRLAMLNTRSLLEESVAIYRELGEKQGLAEALSWLGNSWTVQGNLAAARMPLEEGVTLAREVGDPWLLAKTLRSLGYFMKEHRDFKSARHFAEESVRLYREVKDQRELSFSLRLLSEVAMSEGNLTQATALAQESLALARALEGRPDMIRSLYLLAETRASQGDAEQAVVLLEESLALARDLGDRWQIASSLLTLGGIVVYQGDLPRAETCAQESLRLFRELREKSLMVVALSLLGEISLLQGDLRQARAICIEAVLLAREARESYFMGFSLISLAKVTAAEGQLEQAARLFGAAEPRINLSTELDPFKRADYERAVEGVRAQLREKTFAAAWQEGRAMTLEQVIDDVLKRGDEAGRQ
jgi:predicted ATPase